MRFHRGRRWNYFKDHLIDRFSTIVYKVGVDAGFDCPNRDGTKARGGCAYCSQDGSLSRHQDPKLDIITQIERGRAFCRRRYKAEKFIVYFQAFTNTYAPVPVLKERYDTALLDSSIVGLSIATRPDCLNVENVELLASYAEKLPYFTVELGLQSAFQNRLEWVNRQESLEDYYKAMELLRKYNVPVISHVIFGFPGESPEEMLRTVEIADECGSMGIKLQMLHVIKGTKLAYLYLKDRFPLLTLEEYGNVVIEALERLNPKMEIHRITGETDKASLLAPDWVQFKGRFFDWLDRELEARDTWQGKKFKNNSQSSNKEIQIGAT